MKSLGLLVLASLLLAACSVVGLGQTSTPTPQVVPQEESARILRVEGRVIPHQHASLAAAASGQVSEVVFQEGQTVQAGAVILRLGDQEQYQAEIASAELALIQAEQELEELDKNAGVELAQARQAMALARKDRTTAFDKYENLSKPIPLAQIEKARATVTQAEHYLEKVNDNLEYYQKRYKNKQSMLWNFIDKNTFKDIIQNLEINQDQAQVRLDDARQRLTDLLNHPDEIELAKATADLGLVDARIADIQRDISLLENGPDPDKVAAAEARRKAAQVALQAAQLALTNSEIVAPFTGQIADLSVSEGEWLEANQPAVVLADLSNWEIETDDLTELDVPTVRLGQPVTVRPDALPELALNGTVDAIKDLSEEKRGDVTYTVTILLNQVDPRLRWGMTVSVDFEE